MAGIDLMGNSTGLKIAAANEDQADTLKRIADSQEKLVAIEAKRLDNLELEGESTLANYVLSNLRENADVTKYDAVKEYWFRSMGAGRLSGGADSTDIKALTKLVTKWYKLTRQLVKDWDGWTRFAHPDKLSISTGTKMGSNANMTCEPSTETVAGQDDYAGNPLFAITYCNWKMVNNEPVITAIKDVSPDFSFYDKDKYVGVLQMSAYVHWTELEEFSDHYDRGYCATLKPYSHIEPLPESVAPDGTMREWVLHGACAASLNDDGTYSECYAKEPCWTGMNHNNMNTVAKKLGNGISFSCSCDWNFLKWMTYIKYGSLTLDTIMAGCFNYYYADSAVVAETGVNRVLLASTVALDKYVIGSYIRIDNWNGALDDWSARNKATVAITGKHGVKITDIQKVTIDGTDYTAIYVDGEPFDTSITDGAVTRIYTWNWSSGALVNILGNDGSINLTNGKYPIKLQGIEFAWAQFEVLSDVILNLTKDDNDDYWYQPYVCKTVDKRSTAVTSDYGACNVKLKGTENWQYIKYEKYSNGYYFPQIIGGSSSTYHRDAIYTNKATGTREVLAFGDFGFGSAYGGLSFLHGNVSLGNSGFNFGSRLSPNGVRGS